MSGFEIGDEVKVDCELTGYLRYGTIEQLWSHSEAARISGLHNLDKYYVRYTDTDGGSGWSYGNIITKISPKQ